MSQSRTLTVSPERAALRRELVASIVTGQIAGLIMAVVVMAVFTIFLGTGPLFPVQVIGSFIFGEAATTGFHLPALVAGLILHQGAAFAWSLVFSAANQLAPRGLAGAAVAGLIVGVASQVVDVNLIMPIAMKALHGQDLWARYVPAFWSWAAHVVFGLGFAVYPAVAARLGARRS